MTDHDPPSDQDDAPTSERLARRTSVTSARVAGFLAKSEAAAEPLIESVKEIAGSAVSSVRGLELPGARVRRVRRLGHHPLASLNDLHPDVRLAHPVEVGLHSIDVEDIRGTAVGGGDQRGGDFLPLRPFRGSNWAARWQRLRAANDRLVDLPPIDVVKYDDGYWVSDGHNRVALAKYSGQRDVDANVIELVPPGGRRTETIDSLAAIVEASRPARARVDGGDR